VWKTEDGKREHKTGKSWERVKSGPRRRRKIKGVGATARERQ